MHRQTLLALKPIVQDWLFFLPVHTTMGNNYKLTLVFSKICKASVIAMAKRSEPMSDGGPSCGQIVQDVE